MTSPAPFSAKAWRKTFGGGVRWIAVAISTVLPTLAYAQAPNFGPPVPMGINLAKVPVGSWSEYSLTMAGVEPMKQRYALVARTSRLQTLELDVSGGPLAAISHLIVKVDVDPHAKAPTAEAKATAIQVAGGAPMKMPNTPDAQVPLGRIDAKTLVGPETINLPAGHFQTRLYRDTRPDGSTVSYWISDDVKPLGLVQMAARMPDGREATLSLVGQGKGAKAMMTKAARPFDAAALMKEMQPLAAGAKTTDTKGSK